MVAMSCGRIGLAFKIGWRLWRFKVGITSDTSASDTAGVLLLLFLFLFLLFRFDRHVVVHMA